MKQIGSNFINILGFRIRISQWLDVTWEMFVGKGFLSSFHFAFI
jgi:hypothetical protein